jgi:hypothetical protein
VYSAFRIANYRYRIEILLEVGGSRKELRERSFVHHMISPTSPLFLNDDDPAQLLIACEYGITEDIPLMATVGTTGRYLLQKHVRRPMLSISAQ